MLRPYECLELVFQIFFLVVLFGLFHGLIFLPVALSLFGPPERDDLDSTSETSSTTAAPPSSSSDNSSPGLSEKLSRHRRKSEPVVVLKVTTNLDVDGGTGEGLPRSFWAAENAGFRNVL